MTSRTSQTPRGLAEPRGVAGAPFASLAKVVRGKPEQIRLTIATILAGAYLPYRRHSQCRQDAVAQGRSSIN
jgi:hypothetical protein